MVIAAVVGFCLLVLVLAFLAPRMSRPVQSAGDRTLGAGQRTGGRAPGIIGRLFSKSFGTSRRAVSKSGATGRRGRSRLPL